VKVRDAGGAEEFVVVLDAVERRIPKVVDIGVV
jgi:hypothetical protein